MDRRYRFYYYDRDSVYEFGFGTCHKKMEYGLESGLERSQWRVCKT